MIEYTNKNNTSQVFSLIIFKYLVNTLSSEINSSDNPHRAQWLTTFRALERAELVFENDYISGRVIELDAGLRL